MCDLTITVNGQSTGKSYETTVGERMLFAVTCSKGIVSDTRWHLSGTSICSDFQMAKEKSKIEGATMGAGATMTCCTMCTGQAVVIVEGNVAGKKVVANLSITIASPKVIDFSAKTDDIHFGQVAEDFRKDGLYLTFGGLKSSQKPGIEWTARLVGSAFTAGSYAFVQLMKINRSRSLQGKVVMSQTSGNAWVLDEDVFYGTSECTNPKFQQPDDEPKDFVTARWPKESTMIKGEDSPSTPLFKTMPKEERFRFDEVNVEEHFQTHLMFKSKVPGSIWVSIARLDWFWKAKARFVSDEWVFVEKQWEIDPVGEKGFDLPIWSNNRDKIMRS